EFRTSEFHISFCDFAWTQLGTNKILGQFYNKAVPWPTHPPDGEGELVYVNYGRREDYDQLSLMNVSVNGTIVILRQGKIPAHSKVAYAEQAGALGVLLYGDPQQVAHNQSATWPRGVWLPGDGIRYGTLLKNFGDPETPGTPSYG
ncbi:PREDICTED: glutamate carboxypeptidase 2-like, partial [Priapulus caudatus]|uniref:Glutamate carboxypeptidase 2-like n=1 Tax=Priapulus caudatus TaxID=37621 RepID=A0ABM1F708_PRICU